MATPVWNLRRLRWLYVLAILAHVGLLVYYYVSGQYFFATAIAFIIAMATFGAWNMYRKAQKRKRRFR